MNRRDSRLKRLVCLSALLLATPVAQGESRAVVPADPGRLFYTPAQRAQLEAARTRNVTQVGQASATAGPATVRFDGMVIRSDGLGTRWVNGRPQAGPSGVADLKPGQIRADGKVYEPYQVLRPSPPDAAPAETKESAP